MVDRQHVGREHASAIHAAETVALEDAQSSVRSRVSRSHTGCYTAARGLGPALRWAGSGAYRARMRPDPRLLALRDALTVRQTTRLQREVRHAEAAVTLIVRPAPVLEVLFIERTARAHDPWSGQIALPGGRRADADRDLLATALRETEEETGIAVQHVGHVLGSLDELTPATNRLPPIVIAPFVVAVPFETRLVPSPHEVRSTEWIPIDALCDPRFASELEIPHGGTTRRFPSIVWRNYVIWGLTHRIVRQFLDVAAGAAGEP